MAIKKATKIRDIVTKTHETKKIEFTLVAQATGSSSGHRWRHTPTRSFAMKIYDGRKRRSDLDTPCRESFQCLKDRDSEMEANTRWRKDTARNIRDCIIFFNPWSRFNRKSLHLLPFQPESSHNRNGILGKLQRLAKFFF